MAQINVVTGPLGRVGGTIPYILGVAKYSRYGPVVLRYSKYSVFSPQYRGLSFTLLRHQSWSALDPYSLFLKLVRLQNFDILHTHGYPGWLGLYTVPKPKSLRTIHTVHQIYQRSDVWSEREWRTFGLLNDLMISYCRKADLVTTVSEYGRRRLLNAYDIEARVVRPAVDPNEIDGASAQRARSRWGIESEFFLYAGGMSRQKGLDSTLLLARAMPDRDFLAVGSGTSPSELSSRGLDIPKNVRGLGLLSRLDFMDCLAACRALLVPSRSEMLSTLAIEGMALGKPVVAARIASSEEAIVDGVTGFLFDPDDITEFEEKAIKAFEDGGIGLRARALAAAQYSWRARAAEFDALYEKIA